MKTLLVAIIFFILCYLGGLLFREIFFPYKSPEQATKELKKWIEKRKRKEERKQKKSKKMERN